MESKQLAELNTVPACLPEQMRSSLKYVIAVCSFQPEEYNLWRCAKFLGRHSCFGTSIKRYKSTGRTPAIFSLAILFSCLNVKEHKNVFYETEKLKYLLVLNHHESGCSIQT